MLLPCWCRQQGCYEHTRFPGMADEASLWVLPVSDAKCLHNKSLMFAYMRWLVKAAALSQARRQLSNLKVDRLTLQTSRRAACTELNVRHLHQPHVGNQPRQYSASDKSQSTEQRPLSSNIPPAHWRTCKVRRLSLRAASMKPAASWTALACSGIVVKAAWQALGIACADG